MVVFERVITVAESTEAIIVLNVNFASASVAVATADITKLTLDEIDKIVAPTGTPVNAFTCIPTTSPVVDVAVTVALALLRPQVRGPAIEIPEPVKGMPGANPVVVVANVKVLVAVPVALADNSNAVAEVTERIVVSSGIPVPVITIPTLGVVALL